MDTRYSLSGVAQFVPDTTQIFFEYVLTANWTHLK